MTFRPHIKSLNLLAACLPCLPAAACAAVRFRVPLTTLPTLVTGTGVVRKAMGPDGLPPEPPNAGVKSNEDRAFRFLAELEAQAALEDAQMEGKALPADEEAQPAFGAPDEEEVEQLRELFERPAGFTQRTIASEAPWSP